MNALSQQEVDRFEARFGAFFLQHTKAEIFERALEGDVPLFPVNTPEDVVRDQQLRSRNFWQSLPGVGPEPDIVCPGPAFRSPAGTAPMRRAPRIGEHNEEIYMGELGLSKDALTRLQGAGVL
jgi:formyl-CoA transferase